MASKIIADQLGDVYEFHAPELTEEVSKKLALLVRDCAHISEEVENHVKYYIKRASEDHTLEIIKRLTDVVNEIKPFLNDPHQIITPRVWDSLRDLAECGLQLRQQAESYAQANLENTKALQMAINAAERTLSYPDNKELFEFFHVNPFKEKESN